MTSDDTPERVSEIYHLPARFPGESPVILVTPANKPFEYVFKVLKEGVALLVTVRAFGSYEHNLSPTLDTPVPVSVANAVTEYDHPDAGRAERVQNLELPDDAPEFTQSTIEGHEQRTT